MCQSWKKLALDKEDKQMNELTSLYMQILIIIDSLLYNGKNGWMWLRKVTLTLIFLLIYYLCVN